MTLRVSPSPSLPLFLALALALAALPACQSQPERAAVSHLRQPVLVPILHEGRDLYQGIEPWHFERAGRLEHIPAGAVVDGASVPRPAWWFMSPDGLHRAAAYAHDWTYAKHGHLDNGLHLTRKECDHLFYDFMIDAGVPRFRASVAYNAVRVGGWHGWNQATGQPLILPLKQQRLTHTRRFLFGPRHLYANPLP